MFKTDLDGDASSVKVRRRVFILTLALGYGGQVLWSRRRLRLVEAASKDSPREATIVQFSDSGQRLQTLGVPKVVKSEEEWRRQLSRVSFDITRRADTEIPFTGKFWNLEQKGLYRCVCCANALFSSETKFESGTGWPSFWAPIAAENIRAASDTSFLMVRTSVSCTECDAHLGHVFDDGPEPTNLRYCMNSAALRFVAQ